jgi:anti-sigma B factor antagonist
MEIIKEKNGDISILKITGKLDSVNSPEFENELIDLINNGDNKIIIDFSKLIYISSAGLRVILLGAKKIKVIDGKIAITSLNKNIKEVFDITGFTDIFNIFQNIEEALNNFK